MQNNFLRYMAQSVGFAGLMLCLCSSAAHAERLTIALDTWPPHMNSAVMSGSTVATLGAQLFAGLTRLNAQGQPVPYLASHWEVQENGLRFRFYLVPGAVFHDGMPITAKDVAFSILASRQYHPFKPMLAAVESVQTPAPLIVDVCLSRPFPHLPATLIPALVPILPQHVFDNDHPLPSTPVNRYPIGSGPFKLKEVVPEQYIRLERHPNFFLPDKPRLRELVFRTFWDQEEIPLALQSGDVDVQVFSSPLLLKRMLTEYPTSNLKLIPVRHLFPQLLLGYNMRTLPFSNPKVRKALSLAVDCTQLAATGMEGTVEALTGPLPPGSPFYPPTTRVADIEQANTLLDEAGYMRDINGKRFSFVVDYAPDGLLSRHVLPYLRHVLATRLGIEVQIRSYGHVQDWMQRVRSEDYQAVLDELFAWHDPVVGVHRLYNSTNTGRGVMWTNTGGYNNPVVNKLMLRAETEANREQRSKIYALFQQQVMDDNPFLWLTSIPYTLACNPRVQGMDALALGIMSPLIDVSSTQETTP